MKHKTAELEGALLQYFFGLHAGLHDNAFSAADWVSYASDTGESPVVYGWEQIGPIIERERITVQASQAGDWRAFKGDGTSSFGTGRGPSEPPIAARGDTPLIAAMRAFVAAKLGEEVELP